MLILGHHPPKTKWVLLPRAPLTRTTRSRRYHCRQQRASRPGVAVKRVHNGRSGPIGALHEVGWRFKMAFQRVCGSETCVTSLCLVNNDLWDRDNLCQEYELAILCPCRCRQHRVDHRRDSKPICCAEPGNREQDVTCLHRVMHL